MGNMETTTIEVIGAASTTYNIRDFRDISGTVDLKVTSRKTVAKDIEELV